MPKGISEDLLFQFLSPAYAHSNSKMSPDYPGTDRSAH